MLALVIVFDAVFDSNIGESIRLVTRHERLQLAQEFHYLGGGPVDGADEFAAEDALAVDDVGFGPAGGAVRGGYFLFGITDGHEIYAVQFEKAVVSVAVNVDAYAQNHNSFGLGAFLHGH